VVLKNRYIINLDQRKPEKTAPVFLFISLNQSDKRIIIPQYFEEWGPMAAGCNN